MKNNKTMLALVLVAALALCSVGVVAVADDNDAIIINPTEVIIEAGDDVTQDFSVVAATGTSTFTVNAEGKYTGTLSFYNQAITSTMTETQIKAALVATVVCNGVSGVTFTNDSGSPNTVTVYGDLVAGTMELTSGSITLGNIVTVGSATTVNAFTGSVAVLDGTVDSSATYGTVITLVPATTGTTPVAAHVEISGTTTSAVSTEGYFGGVFNGISNAILGNELTVNVTYKDDGTVDKYVLAGTVAKQDINGASAIGTKVNAEYAIIYNGAILPVTFNTNGVASAVGSFDVTGLKAGTASANAGVTGNYTGILTLNVDVTIATGYTLGAKTVVMNNSDATMPDSISMTMDATAQIINNGSLTVGKSVTLTGNGAYITNYGSMVSKTTFTSIVLNGFYYIVPATTGTAATPETTYVFATLADTIAAAGANLIVVGGDVIINETVSVAATQTAAFISGTSTNTVYIDGTSSITVLGNFSNGLYTAAITGSSASLIQSSNVIIASEATLDLSAATVNALATYPTVAIDANGTLVMKTADVDSANMTGVVSTKIGAVTADTAASDSSITTFINLYTALTTITTSGSEISLLNAATLNKSAALADGVILNNNQKDLTISEDVTLTADGHFQMYEGILRILGTLIINDETEPVITAGSQAGSFLASNSYAVLTGTLTVSTNAKFIIGAYVLSVNYAGNGFTSGSDVRDTNDNRVTANAAGAITVDGTVTVIEDAAYEGNIRNLKTLTISSTGKFVNNNTIFYVETMTVAGEFLNNVVGTTNSESYVDVKNLTITGTFTNVGTEVTKSLGKLIVENLTVDGTLTAGVYAQSFGVIVNKVATINDKATVTGTLGLKALTLGSAYIVSYNATFTSENVNGTVLTTVFYLDEEVYATEYANLASTPIVLLNPEVKGYKVTWYADPVFAQIVTSNAPGKIGDTATTGYLALYGKLTPLQYTVTLTFVEGSNYVINGGNYQSGTLTLDYGTIITAVPMNGYHGDVTVNGSSSVTVSGDFTVTAEGAQKNTENKSMDLVTILLIIITIVIIIMAIIIALKLLRS